MEFGVSVDYLFGRTNIHNHMETTPAHRSMALNHYKFDESIRAQFTTKKLSLQKPARTRQKMKPVFGEIATV